MAFVSAASFSVAGANKKAVCSKVAPKMSGKGFGGGEATRDPEPTKIDPADPKSKQKAIHAADSFAEYLRKRKEADEKKQ
mmetsp:Transcript_11240/g.19198  ORF Transcript_11240/g.19198 Transcript_11240/m.19198 type:complete len:80 (+) Transcript_11240:103-342(+)|eukprot:CAMPEP_0184691264 /NCGR_PEP_ID=MMETSP0313-20130426/160_1 /TAXON_ID=2792 /ORGANISM="Porphyridium aerugineum, Strain SAG 1380-2" /LENGTH=79 /DNA_ID=CAMNT_0027148943 /DNA_START=75 /DNA_END=314 /DNA_ORIENTATION=+